MAIPLQHKIDAIPTYILQNDDAWLSDKIDEEVTKLNKRDADDPLVFPEDDESPGYVQRINKYRRQLILRFHPVHRFMTGHTRYDLDAENIRQYLDMSKQPTMFKFRRLNINEYFEIESTLKSGTATALSKGYTQAFQLCIKSIDKIEGIVVGTHGGMDDGKLEKLRNVIGINGIIEVGKAIFVCSKDLTALELKS